MQSRLMSLVEVVSNIAVGYGIAVLAQIVIFPLFGFHASLADNVLIAGLFTCISLVRSFILRRVFNRLLVADLPIRERPIRPD